MLAALLSVCAPSSHAEETRLDEKLQAILAEEGLTGIAWSLLDGFGAVLDGAVGYRDAPNQLPFTIDTRFHVGSVTKALLATGVLRMASQGLIDLDAPVKSYLPDLPLDNQWDTNVTVKHLLDHTSGLNDAHLWQMFSQRPRPDTPLGEAFPNPRALLEIRSQPGARFSYSNMGYGLLGMIIEAVAGERYEAYLDQTLLQPLGMDDSTFEFTTQEGADADSSLAWGHVDDGSRIAASPIFLRPAGQFTATIADMSTFARFLMSDGAIDGQPFIRPDLMSARGRPSGTEAANGGLEAGYALGLGRRDRFGVLGFCHSGNIVGFLAMVCVVPDENKAFAYSVNTDSETADYSRIAAALVGALELAAPEAPQPAPVGSDMLKWEGRYILSPNRFETFRYLDTVFGAVKLAREGPGFHMTSLQQNPRMLVPVGGLLLSAQDRATASHVFLRSADDGYLFSDGFQTYQRVSSGYFFAHWASVLLGFLGLAWLWAAGVISLVRERGRMLQRAEAPAFIGILLLLLPVPFFLNQSFMALGDMTVASVLLALVTLLLPLSVVLTLVRVTRLPRPLNINLLHGIAAVMVLQWCLVLAVARLLPLRLWA